MKAFAKMLSEETLNELKGKLGEDLTKQINEKLGDYAINPGKEKLISLLATRLKIKRLKSLAFATLG